MAAIRDFVAANRFIRWLLLGVAILNFLQLTVFYRETLRCAACFLWRSRRLPEAFERLTSQDKANGISRTWKRYHRWSRRNYRKPWMWIASMLQAIAMLAVAIAGLVLL